MAAEAGIDSFQTLNNAASYIQSWIKVLRDDPKTVVLAASQAQKAVDLVLGKSWEPEKDAKASSKDVL